MNILYTYSNTNKQNKCLVFISRYRISFEFQSSLFFRLSLNWTLVVNLKMSLKIHLNQSSG